MSWLLAKGLGECFGGGRGRQGRPLKVRWGKLNKPAAVHNIYVCLCESASVSVQVCECAWCMLVFRYVKLSKTSRHWRSLGITVRGEAILVDSIVCSSRIRQARPFEPSIRQCTDIYIRIYMEFPLAIPSPFTFALLIDIFVSLDLINSLCFLLEKRD